jgi:subfamily B ATP-binding cassette protein MsbA
MKTYFRLLRYARPYFGLLLAGFICSTVLSSVNVAVIPIVGKLSEAIGKGSFTQLNLFVAAAIGLYFLKGIFSFGQIYFVSHVNQNIIRDLRVQVFEHLQNLSLDFYSKTRTGDIITIIMNDINMMQNVIVSSFTSIIPDTMTIVGVGGYLFYLNWHLALVSILMLPIITMISTRFGRQIEDIATQTQEKMSDLASVVHEVVTGAKVVKSFTMEKEEIKRFSNVTDFARKIALQATAINAIQTPLFNFIQAIAAVIVIWFGGYEIVSHRISPSNLIAFFTGVLMLGDPIGGISGMNVSIQIALVSAKRVFAVLDTGPTVKDLPDAKDIQNIRGEVEFKGVTFKYESNDNPVLKDINISCKAGEVIAIVGHSGAGKSTLVSLIPRFYDPLSGEILLDGKNLKEYKIRSFRKFIGIVPQETLLFSGSIKDNISYGRTDASDSEVEQVARMANALDFIMSFQEKYKTLIGEKGVRLSGGERQRVAIARAFLRDPKILILDEATSSLDSESEHLVQDALEKLMKGRTTFVIAHRLSTVRFADRILVLEKGAIVEEGKHDDLIKKESGRYKRLYDMQLGKFAETMPNVFGFLDIAGIKIKYGNINTLTGWAISDDNSEISDIRILSEGEVVGGGKFGILRADVNKAFPNFKHSMKCGFKVDFRISENPAKTYSVEFSDNKGRKIKERTLKLSEFDGKTAVGL